MTPYREMVLFPGGRPRSKLRTKWLRALIWARGTWRSRMVRCAVCRKGVMEKKSVYGQGGEPGSKFIRMLLDHSLSFPCGHLIEEHKQTRGEEV